MSVAVPSRRLSVFTRVPVPGAAKTRLIPPLTADQAAALQRAMTEDLLERLDHTFGARRPREPRRSPWKSATTDSSRPEPWRSRRAGRSPVKAPGTWASGSRAPSGGPGGRESDASSSSARTPARGRSGRRSPAPAVAGGGCVLGWTGRPCRRRRGSRPRRGRRLRPDRPRAPSGRRRSNPCSLGIPWGTGAVREATAAAARDRRPAVR